MVLQRDGMISREVVMSTGIEDEQRVCIIIRYCDMCTGIEEGQMGGMINRHCFISMISRDTEA